MQKTGRPPPHDAGGGRERGHRRPLAILFGTVFIDLVGFGIVIPLLPLYAEQFGATPVHVAWLVAVYSLMQFLIAPWWGRLSDRYGRRPILLIGLFGSGISYLLFGLAGSLAGLFLARMLAGAMGANIGVAQAYVADVTSPQNRARGMGLIGAAFGLGFVLGPAIGGLLAPSGMAVPFLFAGALATLNGVLALAWLPEPARSRAAPAGAEGAEPGGAGIGARARLLARLSRDPRMGALYAAFFLLTLAFAALEATLSLWADRRWAMTPAQVAFLFAYLGIVVTLVQGVLIGPMVRRSGERRVAVGGAVVFAAGLVALPLAPGLPTLAVALALLGIGQGAAMPTIAALVSRHAPAHEQGRLLSISQSLSALGRVIGPLWGGVAFARIGIGAPYLSGALLALGAAALLALLLTRGGGGATAGAAPGGAR